MDKHVLKLRSGNLIYLLSHGFLVLLSISALIALPVTYLFFEKVVLTNFPYHTPVQVAELFVGLLAVLLIAFIVIGLQTMKAARSNPADPEERIVVLPSRSLGQPGVRGFVIALYLLSKGLVKA